MLTDAHQALQKVPLLSGISRTYQPKEDDGDQFPPESTQVQVRAADVLRDVAAALGQLFDVIAVKDATNGIARADVVVDGGVLLADVPVTYLLFLEAQLVDLHTFAAKLPMLDPAEQWSYSDDTDCYATAPVQTTKTKKVPRSKVLYEATPQHPAQVATWNEDTVAGHWSTVKFSGALPARRVTELVERVETLQRAVKQAREHANSVPAIEPGNAGEVVFRYLFH